MTAHWSQINFVHHWGHFKQQARPAGRDAAKPPRPTWSRSGSEACLQPSEVGPADGVRVGQRVRRLLVYTSVRFCGTPE